FPVLARLGLPLMVHAEDPARLRAGPARLARLDRRKGRLLPGYDADFVVWDPESAFTVDPAALEHRHAVTPYAWRKLYGKVLATYVGGRPVVLSATDS
ncbi:MAG TPA: amidohydrolase family protein, partial [Gemmatimonadaceae bacterium]